MLFVGDFQVEAEWGDQADEVAMTDPLHIALEARKKELKAEKGETRFVQMAKRSVELASTMALGAPLVSELAADSIAQLVRAPRVHIHPKPNQPIN